MLGEVYTKSLSAIPTMWSSPLYVAPQPPASLQESSPSKLISIPQLPQDSGEHNPHLHPISVQLMTD